MEKLRTNIPLEDMLEILGEFGHVMVSRPKFSSETSPELIDDEIRWKCEVSLPGRLLHGGSTKPTLVGEHELLQDAVDECYFAVLAYESSPDAVNDRQTYLDHLEDDAEPFPDTLDYDAPPQSLNAEEMAY